MYDVPQKWYNILHKYHINQLINERTRVKKNSKTCIDHIYLTNPEHTRSTKVPHISLSDHCPVCYVRKHNAMFHTGTHINITYRLFKNFNEDDFVNDLSIAPWNLCYIFDDPNDALDCWQYLFLEVIDKHAPLLERRVKHAKQPEWFSKDNMQAMFLRDTYASTNDEENMKHW